MAISLGLGLGLTHLRTVPALSFLEQYSGAAAAYSLRDLAGTSPSVVRVRRSSDNTEQDFTAAQINDGSLLSFVGSGDGFVTTWYDQSGNGGDAVQYTASGQPKIVDSGVLVTENGKAALDFDGVDDFLRNTEISENNPNTIITVFRSREIPTDFKAVYDSLQNGSRHLIYPKRGTFTLNGGNVLETFDWDTIHNLFFALFSAFGSYLSKNGVKSAEASIEESLFGLTIGASLLNSGEHNATYQELILYPFDQSANRVDIETNINDYYGIY